MHILFARSGYSPTGGAERYLARLAGGLKQRNIRTTLLNDGSWPASEWPGDAITQIPSRTPLEFSNGVAIERKKHPAAILFSLERIPSADVFRAGDGIHSAFLQRQAAEENPFASWFRQQRSFHKSICRLERELFTENPRLQVICNSALVARELQSMFHFPEHRISIIPNGFTPQPWTLEEKNQARQKIREAHGIPSHAPIVLFVGSGWRRKGTDTLVSAFKKIAHPSAHLILVGKGRLHQRTPSSVHLAGPVKNPRDYYFAADLFALPTLYDPFSNACLEASSYGLPVLTTNANGFAEALENFPQAGEIIPIPRTAAAWAAALDRWLKISPDPAAIRPLAASYSLDLNLSKTLDLLTSLATVKSS